MYSALLKRLCVAGAPSPSLDIKTPHTAKSTTRKTRARKTPDSVPFDQGEKVELKIKKNIKIERVSKIF